MHGLRDYFFIFFPFFIVIIIIIIIIVVVVIIIFTSPFIYIASRKKANVSCIFRNQGSSRSKLSLTMRERKEREN